MLLAVLPAHSSTRRSARDARQATLGTDREDENTMGTARAVGITARVETLREIEHTFGQVPAWVRQLPDTALNGFWSLYQDFRTTRHWQGAMGRAALRLVRENPRGDLRLPMAMTLLELYGEVDDDELIAMMEVLVPIEPVLSIHIR
jgi:hypothetical protein